jgi:O-antigen/teichoic acid export membrane protein
MQRGQAGFAMKYQIVINVLMNVASFTCNIVISLLLVPYLVGSVGIAAYGLVPLAMFLTDYIGLVTQSLTSSVNRYLTVEIHQERYRAANQVFNTAWFGMLGLIVAQIIILAWPITEVSAFIEVPEGLEQEAVNLFALTFANFALSLLTSILSVSMYARNRLDLMQWSNILRALVRVVTIVAIFTLDKPSLTAVGIGSLAGGGVALLFAVLMWRRLTPFLSIRPRDFDFNRLRPLTSMGGWLMVNQVGFLLFSKVDLVLVNRFLGATASGEYAVVLQLSNLVKSLMATVAGVLGPVVMLHYSRGDHRALVGSSLLFTKFLGLASVLPIVLMTVYARDLLTLWLGAEYAHLSWLLITLVCPLVINIGVMPLFLINTAYERVRVPGLVSCLLGLTSLGLSILMLVGTDFGYYGVAIANGLVLTLKNAIFTPLYAARLLEVPTFTFLRGQAKAVLGFALALSVVWAIHWYFPVTGYVDFLVSGTLAGLMAAAVCLLLLTATDRRDLYHYFIAERKA